MSRFNRSAWQRRALSVANLAPSVGHRVLMYAMKQKLNPETVNLEKVRNFVLANLEADQSALRVNSLPYIINIDSVNACNLACPFCVTGTKQLDRRKALFPTAKAKKLIDNVSSHALLARFHNWGEPFLNKEIFELVRYAHEAKIHTTVSSNLSIEVDNLAEKILDSGLDNLHISIDGLTQSTLEIYRRNANLELILKNIKEIVDLKRKRGSRTPRIEMAFLVFRHNEHELARLDEMKRELGVDAFTASSAFIYHDTFVPENRRFPPSQHIWSNNCHYLYSELMVEADGKVSPCCTNTSDKFDVGNVDEINDLHEFWNKPIFMAMRAKSSGQEWRTEDGSVIDTLCDYCQYISSGHTTIIGRNLSPLPPALIAAGTQFDHKIDDVARRV
jgi:radical SAM protein with 4Fe4S-binding SPASM domain